MSTLAGPPVGAAGAIGSQFKDLARAAWVRLPAESGGARDLAFAAYRRRVRRIMREGLASFRVIGSRTVASSPASSVVEVELSTQARLSPGGMLYIWWRNDPGLAECVLDLSGLDARGVSALGRRELLALPRVTPRLYTVSGVGPSGVGSDEHGTTVKVQVTVRGGWPRRASAFLHRLAPGDELRAWVVPHPSRVDRSGPGLAVVTGSGAAGVFAALRGGAEGIDLVWGLGGKQPEPWVLEELDQHRRSGALASLRLLRSPLRVDEAVRELGTGGELAERWRRGDWLYVSGNEAAGEAVHAALLKTLVEETLREASASLRYINSS